MLGGTFNPPHVGHLALARTAARELRLERVLLIPARAAPHKQPACDPGPEHRLAMCRLVAEHEDCLEVSTVELDRPGPSYTVDTLNLIRASHPHAPLTLIMGADMACTLPSWREPEEILRLSRLAVAARPGTQRQAVLDALAPLDRVARTRFLAMPPIEASSSNVRARVAAGGSLDGLVPDAVAAYIEAHRLYREQPVSPAPLTLPEAGQ